MSRVTAPLLSFGASGQVAKAQVYSQWKGVPYVRRYVIPSNPRSTDQMLTRDVFATLNRIYQVAPSNFVAAWDASVIGRALTGRNNWTRRNLPIVRSAVNLNGLVLSPGALGGLQATVALVGGNDQVTINFTAPSQLPAGWTIVRAVGVAIRQQDPHDPTDLNIHEGTDDTAPYSVVLTGLADATTYQAGGWLVYQRSDKPTDLAYGPAIASTVLTT